MVIDQVQGLCADNTVEEICGRIARVGQVKYERSACLRRIVAQNIALSDPVVPELHSVGVVSDFKDSTPNVVPAIGNEVFDIQTIDRRPSVETPVSTYG